MIFIFKEKSKTNAERTAQHLPLYVPDFKVINRKVKFGAVSNLYSLDMARQLKTFMTNVAGDEEYKDPADILMHEPFSKKTRRPLMQIEPSLVTHIGAYSERRDAVSFVNFDVRFQLDAGTLERIKTK